MSSFKVFLPDILAVHQFHIDMTSRLTVIEYSNTVYYGNEMGL